MESIMFAYTDPAGRNFLGDAEAQQVFRQRLQGTYDGFARRPNSALTWIEAFGQLSGGQPPSNLSVEWRAFPLTANTTDKNIDKDRFRFQDEYVEWRAETKQNKLVRVTFITEFPEYFEAFAAVGYEALKTAVADVIPDADPTAADLFGAGFEPNAAPPIARSQSFRDNLPLNPWNNGQKGILCLTQQFNTLGALFNLLTACGVPRAAGTPQDTCGLVGGACGEGRSSDPTVCAASQQAARDGIGYTLRDPAGIRISKLEGVWKLNGAPLDVNDPDKNEGAWVLSRNGRRGVLTVLPGLTLDDDPLATGAQIAHKVVVAADLLAAPDAALPDWARIGAESGSRGPD
jgi:hypothetical protein